MNLPDAALEMQGKVIGLCGELNVALRKTFLSPHFPMHTCDSSMNARRILARKRVHGGSAVIRLRTELPLRLQVSSVLLSVGKRRVAMV